MKTKPISSVAHGAGALLLFALLGPFAGCADDGASPSGAPEEKAGQPEPSGKAANELSLVLVEDADGQAVVDLVYSRPADIPGPRMMELYIKPSEEVKFLSGEALSSVQAAGKELVLQEQADGQVRTVVYTTANLNRLEPGPLVRYRFSVGQPGAMLELVDRRPLFAPAEADGVVLAEPLQLGGR